MTTNAPNAYPMMRALFANFCSYIVDVWHTPIPDARAQISARNTNAIFCLLSGLTAASLENCFEEILYFVEEAVVLWGRLAVLRG